MIQTARAAARNETKGVFICYKCYVKLAPVVFVAIEIV